MAKGEASDVESSSFEADEIYAFGMQERTEIINNESVDAVERMRYAASEFEEQNKILYSSDEERQK